VNGLARLLVRRSRTPMPDEEDAPTVSRGRRVRSGAGEGLVLLAVLVGALPLVLILGQIVVTGGQQISWSFLTEVQPVDPNAVAGYGIGNALVGTLIINGIALAIAAPLGILTALFMYELARASGWSRRLADGIGFFTDIMLGMPSIVAGLTVYLVVVLAMQRYSALAGGIALAIVMFPIVVRGADEVLRLVPQAQREAALALGAPRWRTAWSVVLPAAAPGILTGVVLAVARAAGETAPLLFTSLGSQVYSTDLLEPVAALPQLIYTFVVQVRTDQSVDFAWGATFVLVAVILVLNTTARLVARIARPTEAR
jgi:phosphate transport system permease protein